MSVEYGRNGLIGILTPQANTTVEPECSILLPPGYAMIAARLTSDKPTIDERLVDYLESIDATLDRFANAPVDSYGFACTGASYLVGAEREADLVKRISDARGKPFITAGDAIAEALAVLEATSVAIISPYDDPLHRTGLDYWASRDLQIVDVSRLSGSQQEFHPIYSLSAGVALAGATRVAESGADAIVMLGTGLPTLSAILSATDSGLPVLSSNLCLMWRVTLAAGGEKPDAASLRSWLDGSGWQKRFEMQTVQERQSRTGT